MSTKMSGLEPLVKVVEVGCDVDSAFRVFTERIADWWPLHTHSIHQERAATCRMEGEVGGELYELSDSGERAHWAQVEAWEPPNRLLLSWHVNPESPAPTEIEVRFEALGPERTRVELVHRNWELLGPELGVQARGAYDEGWDPTLASYAVAAEKTD
jgi:uncharacterized protein YndB with AHSA1/START domain